MTQPPLSNPFGVAVGRTNVWQHSSAYQVVKVSGVEVIQPRPGATLITYDPLEQYKEKKSDDRRRRSTGTPPRNRPGFFRVEADKAAEELAYITRFHELNPVEVLALWRGSKHGPQVSDAKRRLMVRTLKKRAVEFANNWGLLGLGRVEYWKDWRPWGRFSRPSDPVWLEAHHYPIQEPLEAVLEAATRFAVFTNFVTRHQDLSGPERERSRSMISLGFHRSEVGLHVNFEVPGLEAAGGQRCRSGGDRCAGWSPCRDGAKVVR